MLVPAGNQKNIFLEREERATTSVRRSCCSLLTIIADCLLAQKLFPLILLVNEATVPEWVAEGIARRYATSEHCWLMRRKSAWVNADVFVWLLGVLRKCLAQLEPIAQFVLLIDCSPVHATRRIAQAAALNSIVLVYIAPHMTGAMQPLDVNCFATLKKRIRDAYETAGHGTSNGHVNTLLLLSKMLEVAETYIVGASWAGACEGCGYGAYQAHVGQRLRG